MDSQLAYAKHAPIYLCAPERKLPYNLPMPFSAPLTRAQGRGADRGRRGSRACCLQIDAVKPSYHVATAIDTIC